MSEKIYVVVDADLFDTTKVICAFTSFEEAEKYITEFFLNGLNTQEEEVIPNKEKIFYYYHFGDNYSGSVKIQAIPLYQVAPL